MRRAARQIPQVDRIWTKTEQKLFYAKYNLRDVYDSYLSRSIPPKRTPLGFTFSGLSSSHHRAMQEGTFEPQEVSLLSSLIRVSDVFIDVGANVGYYTCLARSLGKPAVAIEPMPMNLRFLYENLRANSWEDTEVLPMGMSDHQGIATLFGASSTGASLVDSWAGAPSTFKRTIPISTLDRLFDSRFAGARLMIKVDVEGHEYRALKGAVHLLARAVKPIWLIEITLHEFHPDGPNPQFAATFELFWQQGYSCHMVVSDRLEPVSREDVEGWVARGRTPTGGLNYLFIPADAGDVVSLLRQ